MKFLSKKKTALLSIACIASSAFAQEDVVLATVNGEKITSTDLQAMTQGAEVPPQAVRELLEQLISSKVLMQQAVNDGLQNREDYKVELKLLNEAALGRAYVNEFVKNNEVNDAEVEESYAAFRNVQAGRQEFLSRHILVETEDEAIELVTAIDGNLEEFIKLAAAKSIDTGSGANGGQLGWADPQGFVPEFSEALVALSPGTFSSPVQSQFGWHIIYLDDTRDVEVPELTPEVSSRIAQNLLEQKIQAEIDRLRTEAKVEFNDAAINSL